MISIIIPLYNQSKQLDLCLGAIAEQTYSNYEIIVVNDRSTQKLSHIIEKWKKHFGISISFHHNKINHGAPYTRNKGFKKSKGELVIFCDADVIMRPNMLEKMHRALKDHPEASYAYSAFKFGNKIFKSFAFDEERLKFMPYIHSSSLIRREHFPEKGWDENLKRLQDWDLWLSMLEAGYKGFWIEGILFKVIKGGTMSSWLPKITYKLCPFLPSVRKYNYAKAIILKKHNLV